LAAHLDTRTEADSRLVMMRHGSIFPSAEAQAARPDRAAGEGIAKRRRG
jgi:hypothetical protein